MPAALPVCIGTIMAALRKQPVSQRDRKAREGRTSFCEQKEAKKLYLFSFRAVSAPREAEQKFFGSFFQKRTS
jgi:hypothetical protein